MRSYYVPVDDYRGLQTRLADAQPSAEQPDLKSVIAEILAEFGIVPDYCREAEGHRFLRRRNFV